MSVVGTSPSRIIYWLASAYTDRPEGVFFKSQVEALSRQGLIPTVIAPTPVVPMGMKKLSDKWKFYSEQAKFEQLDNVKIFRPRYFAHPREIYIGFPHHTIALAARSLNLPKPDLIHAHYSYPFGLAAHILASKWKCPYVVTFHGSDVNHYPEHDALAMRRFMTAVGSAAHLIAVSKLLAKRAKDISGKEPEFIPIGINLKDYDELPDKATARDKIGLRQGLTTILFVGNHVKEKGVEILLTAARQVVGQDFQFVFVGDGPLKKEVTLTPSCISVGIQPPDKVRMYMRAADMIVLPSFSEGMPMVLVEAGAAKCPIAATSVGGIHDFLSHGRGTFLKVGDPESLVNVINQVKASPLQFCAMAKDLQQYVRENYDVDANARKLIAAYERVFSESLIHPTM